MQRAVSLLVILLFSLGAAQRGVTVSGTTEDQTGAAIAEESLTLTNKVTGASYRTVSEASGNFSFKDVAPGDYTLKGEAEGFTTSKLKITVGTQALANIKIKMAVSVSDEVTINSKQSEPVSPENNAGLVYL